MKANVRLRANKAAIEKYYLKVFDHSFSQEDSNEQHVAFFPDLLAEREKRISAELQRAAEVSEYERNRLAEKYAKIDPLKRLPVSYSDFKKRHFNLARTAKNYTQQMMVMKMVRAAIEDSDYRKVNHLFDYLLVNKEEEQIRKSIRLKIDAFERASSAGSTASAPSDARDPVRVLLKYVRRPNDDIETLVNKYILLVPELYDKVKKLRDRKQFLHNNVKSFIREKDAMFVSEGLTDKLRHFELDALKDVHFDVDNENAREALQQLNHHYEALIGNAHC